MDFKKLGFAVQKRKSDFIESIGEALIRIVNAFTSLKFISYTILSLLVIGGAGLWVPYYADSNKTDLFTMFETTNVFTFVAAVFGTMLMGVFEEKMKKDSQVNSYSSTESKSTNLFLPALLIGSLTLFIAFDAFVNHKGVAHEQAIWVFGITVIFYMMTYSSDEQWGPVIGGANAIGGENPSSDTFKNPEDGKNGG